MLESWKLELWKGEFASNHEVENNNKHIKIQYLTMVIKTKIQRYSGYTDPGEGN